MQSPAAQILGFAVRRNSSTTTWPRSVISTPSSSRPMPAACERRPTETSSFSALTFGAVVEPHRDAVVAVLGDLGDLASRCTVTPSFSSRRWNWAAVRLSMPSSSRGRISTTVIRVPSGAKRLANSQPITPPPTMIIDSGTSSSTRMSFEVRTAGWSMSKPGRPDGSVPTQTTRWSKGYDSPSTTTASPSTRPWPRTTSTPLRLAAPSTPLRMRRTISSLRSIILGKSNETSGTTRPYSSARRTRRSRSAVASSDFVGMQPQFMHVPPSSARSIRVEWAPSWAARSAATSPAGPPPSTTTRGAAAPSPPSSLIASPLARR